MRQKHHPDGHTTESEDTTVSDPPTTNPQGSFGEHDDVPPTDNINALDAWKNAWARLISYAWDNWENEEVITSIKEHPEWYLAQFGWQPNLLGFFSPKIVVKCAVGYVPSPIEPYDPDASPSLRTNGWKDYLGRELAGVIVVIIPPKPSDPGETLQALDDYMQICRNQPFTCT